MNTFEIAMKIYKPYILELQDQITRIESEAEIGMNINGKNLVKIYDYNINLNRQNGTYLIMEYIEGITLDKWIKNNIAIKF